MPEIEVEWAKNRMMGVANLLSIARKEANRSPTGEVWFRGVHNKKFSLVPSIAYGRAFCSMSMNFDHRIEQRLLDRFRRFARQFEGRSLDPWETMFLARHHGLPVRLMDWTGNPLVAFYLACEHAELSDPPDGCIWMLVPGSNRSDGVDLRATADPLKVRGVRLVHPMVVSPRISVQSGIFTIQDDPWRSLTDYGTLPDDDLDIHRLVGYEILGRQKKLRLKELNDIGINRRTLFPDYDGLARGLIGDEILRRHADELNKEIRERTPETEKNATW